MVILKLINLNNILKSIILSVFLALSISCCKTNKKFISDNIFYNFSSKVVCNYKLNDVIYFKSNQNDYDTIKIVEIDTIIIRDPVYAINKRADEKIINIKIQYLPKIKTFEGYVLGKTKKYDSISNQPFLSIHAVLEGEPYYNAFIDYQGLSSELPLKKNTDTILNPFIKTKLVPNNNSNRIVELYWTKNKGLTGYKTNDNQIYKAYKHIVYKKPNSAKSK